MEQDEYFVWIEAEEWAPGEWDPIDCNSDVKVSFRHGSAWVATFFTYKNVMTLVDDIGKAVSALTAGTSGRPICCWWTSSRVSVLRMWSLTYFGVLRDGLLG